MLKHVLEVVLFIATFTLLILSAYAFQNKQVHGARMFSVILVGMSLHAAGYAMELMSASAEQMIAWLKLEYVGIAFFPFLFFWFINAYMDECRPVKRWIRYFILGMNVATLILVLTLEKHTLFYKSVHLGESLGMRVLVLERGIWSYVHIACLFTVLTYCFFRVVKKWTQTEGPYRTRAGYMMLGLLVPMVVYVAYLTELGPKHLEYLPFLYAFMGILIGIGLFRHDILFMTPVTYKMVFQAISEGVLVVDQQGLLVKSNESAKRMFPELADANDGCCVEGIPSFSNFDFQADQAMLERDGCILQTKRIESHNQRGIIYVIQDVTLAERGKRELEILASVDPLTGVQNRRVFMGKLDMAPSGVFAILDLDNFKEINDQKGHLEGDRILRVFAQALQDKFAFQQVCRFGGEEFAIFFPKENLQAASRILEDFRMECIRQEIGVAFSAGMASYHSGQSDAAIAKADMKLYQAKAMGRNQIQI